MHHRTKRERHYPADGRRTRPRKSDREKEGGRSVEGVEGGGGTEEPAIVCVQKRPCVTGEALD